MNILIPHHWLLEHLDTKAKPKKIAEYLSLCGPSVEHIETIRDEPVYDIEVTTNRVDSMSIKGIAREAATILPEFGVKASLKGTKPAIKIRSHTPLDLEIKNDPVLCSRIIAIKMSVGQVGPSPDWLAKRLEQVGQRPLNNLIDITNYVMWEIGHPIHVFDYDLIKTKKIIVRKAKKDERFTTLDDKTHTTRGGEVVFDDGTGTIIDLPGIIGTKNSVVSAKTKNILVWIEDVDATLIRRASMGLAIRTQAAILNEKNVDPELGLDAISRATDLYIDIAKAAPESSLTDIYLHKPKIKSCSLTQEKLDTYMGLQVKPQRVTRILTSLGCKVSLLKPKTPKYNIQNTKYSIIPPSFRAHDLQIPEDYIEEVARIYGYHNLPSTLMDTPIPEVTTNVNHSLEHLVKLTLANWGLHEVYTYSLVSKLQVQQSGHKLASHLKLKNPLTEDWVYLRKSLVPSHLQVFDLNKNKDSLTIFELANIYIPTSKSKLPNEQLNLVISTTRKFSRLKGILDSLAEKLRWQDYRVEPKINSKHHPEFDPKNAGQIKVGDKTLGVIGHTKLGIVSCQLNFIALESVTKTHPSYIKLSKFSPIIEDLTFKLPPKTHLAPIVQALKNSHPPVKNASLKDTYEQNFTFTVTYLDTKKQLKDEDITPIRKKLVNKISRSFHAKLVGKI